MAHKILKSLLPTEEHVNAFQRLCNNQIEEMRAHAAHMKMVKKDPKKYQAYPAPHAHPDVLNCIVKDGDDFNLKFEIVDDVAPPPPPTPTLDEKKIALAVELYNAAASVRAEVTPPQLKARLHHLEIAKINAIPESDRTVEQSKKMNAEKAVGNFLMVLEEVIARAESEIHDLTEKNIGNWKLPKFPEIKR